MSNNSDIIDVQLVVTGDRGTETLIHAWSDSSIQNMTKGARSHKEVFQKIAEKLPGHDASSCQKKMQTLKREYQKFKDKFKKNRPDI